MKVSFGKALKSKAPDVYVCPYMIYFLICLRLYCLIKIYIFC